MKTLLVAIFAIFSFTSNAQDWEVAISPWGEGNYGTWGDGYSNKYGTYEYTFFASGFLRSNKLVDKKAFTWRAGVGLTYSYYQGKWRAPGGGVYQNDYFNNFAKAGIIGIELVPIIWSFGKRIEFRTGLMPGFLANLESNKSRSSFNFFVLHWVNRLSFNFHLEKFRIAPFYQFSAGLKKEVSAPGVKFTTSFRHNVGFTFGINKKKN